uniref:NUMOD4 domain-containing protein n=1 Tax=viral metagenome TaxID=1070528 RepID=A0A6C0LKQ4_9ZZZZ
MAEEWRDIEGYDDYEISNMGRVWSSKNRKHLSLIDNTKQRTDNTSGVKGVCWDNRGSNRRNLQRSKQ